MKIINEHWFPIAKTFAEIANAEEMVFVYMEDVDKAGMYDPEKDRIVVNVAPNVLAGVSHQYGIDPIELEKIALAVLIEEIAHSFGAAEPEAKAIASLVRSLPEIKKKESGIVGYIRYQLEKENKADALRDMSRI